MVVFMLLSRTDKQQSPQDKVKAVEEILARDSQS